MAWWQYLLIALAVFYVLFGILAVARYRQKTRDEATARVARHGWWRWQWSQDGWVRKCKICGAVQYGGDDYDGGPDASGNVEA